MVNSNDIEETLNNVIKVLEEQIKIVKKLKWNLPEYKWQYFKELKEYKILLELERTYGNRIIPVSGSYSKEKQCDDPNCKIPHIFSTYSMDDDYGGEFGSGNTYWLCNKDKLEILYHEHCNSYMSNRENYDIKGYYIVNETNK
jgi:hypothetical protein